ncbi:MAG: tRNA 4-thiouridine(8) synthase ThiI [Kangiellaceae bacterium]|nr:tRNA 4-thiouridine(8) synthase ThiI [Kangiellaceae bacterium]
MKFVIKLFPEIIVKSRPVRKQFISQLRKNLKKILTPIVDNPKISGSWDLIELDIDDEQMARESVIVDKLQTTPGIDFFLKVNQHSFESIDDIAKIVIDEYAEAIKGKTFCVRVKRSGKHSFNSINVEQQAGGALFHNSESAGVKLKNPEVKVQLEIRGDVLLTVVKRYPGLGGFPMGQQESCISLISGGFDSSVASYMMMKRGIRTHYCFFNLGGIAHEVGVKQVSHYLWEKYSSSHRILFITIPFEKVVSEILSKIDHTQMGVVLKRMMLRVASKVADEFNAPALVTGEAVGQVSSQTLTNLAVIDEVCDYLVMRPLIVMDKPDIIQASRNIGVEGFAAVMPEYCGVISNKPTTRAKLHKIKAEESRFDFSILDAAFEGRKVENIDEIYKSSLNLEEIEIVNLPTKGEVVLDIRHPHEQALTPLNLTANPVKTIPFFKLQSSDELSKEENYLLYCDKGIMSQLQAEELSSSGYNVRIYQPD